MTYAETIRAFREAHPRPNGQPMSYEALARYLEVSRQTVWNWEHGRNESVGAFRTMILNKLAAYSQAGDTPEKGQDNAAQCS